MQNGMFDMTIADEKDKEVRTTVMMDKHELEEYIKRLNMSIMKVSYYEVARLDEQKKGYQKKYIVFKFLRILYCFYFSNLSSIPIYKLQIEISNTLANP